MNLSGTDYAENLVLAQTGAAITGGSLALLNNASQWTITGGTVDGDTINFDLFYNASPSLQAHFTGTIAGNGSMSGTWADTAGGTREGTWETTTGHAISTVVAPPSEPVSCPLGTTQSAEPVETVVVDSTHTTATVSANALENGKDYILVASGTWTNLPYNVADAEFTSTDAWASHMDGYDVNPYFLGEGEFDLKFNNAFVNWGAYTGDHTYARLQTGTGALASFLIFDGNSNTDTQEVSWYGDNTGSLSVAIYSCIADEPPQPPEKDKNDCKKDGWKALNDDQGKKFRNQGDCVSFYATQGRNKAWNGHDERENANDKGQIGKGHDKGHDD